MIFKTFKKLARVPCPCMIVQDRERPCETVYTTAHEVHSTSELNRVNIIYKSYRIVWNRSQVLHPTPGLTLECHTITVRFTRVYTWFYTIAIWPIRFHMIAIRPIRFKYELYVVKYDQTRSLRLYKARVWSYSTRTQQKTQLPAATLKQQSTCYIMPPKKKKVPKRILTMEDSPSENTKMATKALRPLQPVDPDELEDPLPLPDEIPRVSYWPNMTLLLSHSLVQTCLLLLLLLLACSCLPSRLLAKKISMSISLIMISNSLILSSAICITSLLKVRKFMKPSHQNESIYIKTYTNVW